MSTSNSTDFSMTRDEIIEQVLIQLGVYSQLDVTNGLVTSSDYIFCAKMLNMMVKDWEGDGIHLWTQQEGTIFLTYGQQKYSLSSSSSDIAGDDALFTTLTNTGAGSSIVVGSVTGMSVNDNIGIVLDNNTIQWTTISSITPSTLTVGLNASISSTASAGNNVFSFTNRIDRPLHILGMRARMVSGAERPVYPKGRKDYMEIPNKNAIGPINQFYYAPLVSQAYLYNWPTCDNVGECLNISYLRRVQDFDNSSDNPDAPQEWYKTIVDNLAVYIAPSYGIDPNKLNPDLVKSAERSYAKMEMWDSEEGSLTICNNYEYEY